MARIRNELYAVLRALSNRDYVEAVASTCTTEDTLTVEQLKHALAPYESERGAVQFDARVKQGWTTRLSQTESHVWEVSQLLVDDTTDDPDSLEDVWSLQGLVDLRESTNPSGPIVRLVAVEVQ
jgi:hypothetical protein